MNIFKKLFGNQTSDSCSRCGKFLGKVVPFTGIVRTRNIPTSNDNWCYQCGVCGRITCYDCSDNTQKCECGHNKWIESIVL